MFGPSEQEEPPPNRGPFPMKRRLLGPFRGLAQPVGLVDQTVHTYTSWQPTVHLDLRGALLRIFNS